MRSRIGRLVLASVLAFTAATFAQIDSNPPKKIKAVLVYSHEGTGSYRHTNGITAGNALIVSLGAAHGFTVTVSEDPNFMTYDNMKKFDVIVFNNTVGASIPSTPSQEAFVKYMNEGGGFLGIHGAMDHHDYWKWYADEGVDFNGHTSGTCFVNVDTAGLKNPEYGEITGIFPKTHFLVDEEWYAFKTNPRDGADIILTVDETSPGWGIPATQKMGDHAVAWAKKLPALPGSAKQGHYFYMSIGHGQGGVFKTEPYINDFVYQSLRWAGGEKEGTVGVRETRALPAADPGALSASRSGLELSVTEPGPHRIEIFDTRGRKSASVRGSGPHAYAFPGLRGQSVYLAKIVTSKQSITKRVFLP